jgi:2'-hydroxyisoflavone reductase
MPSSRREFLSAAALAAAAAAIALPRPAAARFRKPGPKHILILGGTGFLGPACTQAALDRGHRVTLFNRGRIESLRKEAGRPSNVPAGVDVLFGNRDPEKHADEWKDAAGKADQKSPESPKGLTQLEGKTFDGVIDTSAYFPRIARASAALLAPNISRYVFVSTISVYPDNSKPGMDESAQTATLEDPKTEDLSDMRNYGPGKADAERAVLDAAKDKATIVRPGFIVGPRDTSGRFLYWPLRMRRGGQVALPGTPDDPIQLIDVRDLADFLVRLIETDTPGTFNATGPAKELSMQRFAEGVRAGVASKPFAADDPAKPVEPTTFAFLPPEFLDEHNVSLAELPLWVPPSGPTAGFHRVSIAKALSAGITFRPLEDTTKVTLEWFDALPEDLRTRLSNLPFKPGREAEVLKAWNERSAKKPG